MKSTLRTLGYLLIVPAIMFINGCDDHDDDNGHQDLEEVRIIDRSNNQILGTWVRGTGWDVDVLYELSMSAEEDLTRVSLGARMFNDHGGEITLGRNEEYEVRYWLAQGAQAGVIDFSLADDLLFHGDHVHIYGLTPGETQIEFTLWHANHADAATDEITFKVVE
jgi:hypothetical protein